MNNNGKILLIASPVLQEKDIEAINRGYADRLKIVEKSILDSMVEPTTYFEEERLNVLAHLIANGILDIRIAFFERDGKLGLYHEKIGLVYDEQDNVIAFTGSMNESATAFADNFESIDVFCSWKGQESLERVMQKEKDFNALWTNQTRNITVVEFPKVAREKLESYRKPSVHWDIDQQEYKTVVREAVVSYLTTPYPAMPSSVKLYDYQLEAVNQWEQRGFNGIFNMATGTGKTFTALAGIVRLFNLKRRLAVIIVCPYQHLVEQWVEDLKLFNMDPVVGYSMSSQRDWRRQLRSSVMDYVLGLIDHFCFVTTNATFSIDYVQHQICRLREDVVLVIDEAHNFGATNLSSKLVDHIPYRLALSATIERHADPEGTRKLFDYFGEECINYSLERAIREKKLTPYYYYPILTHLTNGELHVYKRLSRQMAQCFVERGGKAVLTEAGKRIALKRAKVVAGARNKLTALADAIQPYRNRSHILVYCGATTISDVDYVEGLPDQSELRQIDTVVDLLGNQLGMAVSKFTSQENTREREVLKREFARGENLQALIAIRCLDEGVNIPRIQTAFILASSTNPKEYIQRRGRVLRLAPGKEFAEIYDFITIPRPLRDVKHLPETEIRSDISLIKKEIARVQDFADLSLNPQLGYKMIDQLRQAYDLDKIDGGAADNGS